jgi:hypothetical protein
MRARWIGSLLLLFALALPALGQDRRGGSLDRILPQVRQTVPGNFYDAEGPFFGANGRATYRLKWMTPDGRIIWFSVDASTGQVLGGGPPVRPRDSDRSGWGHNSWQNNGGDLGGNQGSGGGRNNWGDGDRGSWGDRGGDRSGDRGGGDWGRGGNDSDNGGRGGNGGGWGNRGGDRGGDRGSDRGRSGRGGWGGSHGGGNQGNGNQGGGGRRRPNGG